MFCTPELPPDGVSPIVQSVNLSVNPVASTILKVPTSEPLLQLTVELPLSVRLFVQPGFEVADINAVMDSTLTVRPLVQNGRRLARPDSATLRDVVNVVHWVGKSLFMSMTANIPSVEDRPATVF